MSTLGIKEFARDIVPSGLRRARQLRIVRKRTGGGLGIQSPAVSSNAVLDATAEIAEGVWVGGFAVIGRHTYLHAGTEVLCARIGNFCSIARNCHIGMFQHPVQNVSTSGRLYLRILQDDGFYNDMPKPAIIGNDVWLGSGSIVMGGVNVGDGAVVGANAVVTKDVPPYAVVGGVPAKVIRYRFTQEKINQLIRVAWWNWTDEEISENAAFFKMGPDELPSKYVPL